MRKCSRCGNTGHNSRTCQNSMRNNAKNSINGNGHNQSLKLFGVQFTVCEDDDDDDVDDRKSRFGPLRKSFSIPELSSSPGTYRDKIKKSYSCGGLMTGKSHQGHRKKGVAWSKEEHTQFLLGLEKLGRGDWRGISKEFVTTRTSTQVASHAQKYFLRLKSASKNANSTVERNIDPQMSAVPNYYRTLFNINSATERSSLSLELSLAPPPSLVHFRWPATALWKKYFVV